MAACNKAGLLSKFLTHHNVEDQITLDILKEYCPLVSPRAKMQGESSSSLVTRRLAKIYYHSRGQNQFLSSYSLGNLSQTCEYLTNAWNSLLQYYAILIS